MSEPSDPKVLRRVAAVLDQGTSCLTTASSIRSSFSSGDFLRLDAVEAPFRSDAGVSNLAWLKGLLK